MIESTDRIYPNIDLRQPRRHSSHKSNGIQTAVHTQRNFPAREYRFRSQGVHGRFICDQRPALALSKQHLERVRLDPEWEGRVRWWYGGEYKASWLEDRFHRCEKIAQRGAAWSCHACGGATRAFGC